MWCRISNQATAQKLKTPIHKYRGDDILEQKCCLQLICLGKSLPKYHIQNPFRIQNSKNERLTQLPSKNVMVTYGKEGRPLLKAHKLDYMHRKAISNRSSLYSCSLQKQRQSVGLQQLCFQLQQRFQIQFGVFLGKLNTNNDCVRETGCAVSFLAHRKLMTKGLLT